jgi:hypothetical protein
MKLRAIKALSEGEFIKVAFSNEAYGDDEDTDFLCMKTLNGFNCIAMHHVSPQDTGRGPGPRPEPYTKEGFVCNCSITQINNLLSCFSQGENVTRVRARDLALYTNLTYHHPVFYEFLAKN